MYKGILPMNNGVSGASGLRNWHSDELSQQDALLRPSIERMGPCIQVAVNHGRGKRCAPILLDSAGAQFAGDYTPIDIHLIDGQWRQRQERADEFSIR